ncbi:MAG: hypothetical protein E7067_07600 [Lentimicrobiaceae bacterium]|nr:hypothetical protein [Lentimicrobiaceae bacterium]
MKKILTLLFIITMISCNRNNIVEDVVTRHEDGNKKIAFSYKVDKDGNKTKVRETWYYMEGMKHLDGPIVNDKRNGEFETYYKTGQVMSKGYFVDGIREGEAVTYNENGNIRYMGQYKNGKECGIWKFYDEEGNIVKEINKDLQ